RVDLGTHIAARDRVHLAVEQAPFFEGEDIDLVERTKTLLGEGRGGAQLAGAERCQRTSGLDDVAFDLLEARLEWDQHVKSHALEHMVRKRRDAAAILEHTR